MEPGDEGIAATVTDLSVLLDHHVLAFVSKSLQCFATLAGQWVEELTGVPSLRRSSFTCFSFSLMPLLFSALVQISTSAATWIRGTCSQEVCYPSS